MNCIPQNNLDEHLAQFAANRKSRSVTSAPQSNRKFTFRKVSSLNKSHTSNSENTALKSVENRNTKSETTNASFHIPLPSVNHPKSALKSQVNGYVKVSGNAKQQSITNHFQPSQKQASTLSKTNDSLQKSSFMADGFDDFFDDLSDFDIPSTAFGNNDNGPLKKSNAVDSSGNKSNLKSPSNQRSTHFRTSGSSKNLFASQASKSNDSNISGNAVSKLNDSAVSVNFDDDDDIICISSRKKKPVYFISDDETENNEKSSKSLQKETNKKGQAPSFPILNNSNPSDGFPSADVYLRGKDQSVVTEAISPMFDSSRAKPVNTTTSSFYKNNSPSLSIKAIVPPLKNNETKSLDEYSNHPLLHKNHFQNETTNMLQSTLSSLKDLNFSVMTEICSVLEKDVSILSQNKHIESLIRVREKILAQCKAAEGAMTSNPQLPLVKSATVSPFYSEPAEMSEDSLKNDKNLLKLQSTPLFHTAASQLRMNKNNNNNFSGNVTPGFSNSINRPFNIVTPISRSSPEVVQSDSSPGVNYSSRVDESPLVQRSVLDESESLLEDCNLNPEDFCDDEVFDLVDCDMLADKAPVKTVVHDIYGKAPESSASNNSRYIDDKVICGKFYGNYRDDGASMQFKGMGFPHSEEMMNVFRNVFGLKKFRHNQLEAINAALLNEDCFILMPTGGGKSLCYQLPALLTPGVTIVVSPLRSLIMDQVQKLWSLDIPANSLSGDVDVSAANGVYLQLALRNPELKLLYVTPEKISASNKLISAIESLFTRKMLARFVIDEAHCVSQWGHDFRPDYKRLKVLREKFPGVPMIALTATATPRVRVDILQQLGMSSPKWFLQSFNRPNLKYEVRPKKSKSLVQDITELIKSKFKNMSGIIYCLSRNDCDNMATQLCKNQIKAISYHAGLDNNNRNQVQEMWINDQFKVVCATIAFGMGIDKPDVRFVIHHTIPKSIEGYYQESGRAGRDGELSWCILYYNYQDMHRIKRMISGDETNRLTMSTHFSNLFKMVHFCENTTDCRRVQVLEYFGEVFDKQLCSKFRRAECDNCFSKDVFETCDVTEDAKAIVQCMANIIGQNDHYTLTYFVDIFKGSKTQKIISVNHNNLPLHGRGSNYRRSDAERLLRKLVLEQFLQENLVINRFTELPCSYVYLGKRANELLHGTTKVLFPMKKDSKNRSTLQIVPEQEDEEMKQLAERCYNELIEVSKAIAANKHMHYTNIVNVEALRQMSREMPMSEKEMLAIPHVTRAIFVKYGQQFLEVTQRYKAEKCVIEEERIDKKVFAAFIDDDDESWSNPPSPAGNASRGRPAGKRKKPTTNGAPAKKNKKYFQSKGTKGKWKKSFKPKNKGQSFSNGSFKAKASKSNFCSTATILRRPGFLPVPKPGGKIFPRSFLPAPRVISTS